MGLGGLKEQKAFEKSIWEKVKRGGGESFLTPLSLELGACGVCPNQAVMGSRRPYHSKRHDRS